MALRETVKRLACQEFLGDLTLELDAVKIGASPWLPSSESTAHRSILFTRAVRPEGPTPEHALGRRHDLSRNQIRIWVEKAEAGSLDQDMASAELLTEYEARIAALERLVGRQALEIEFQKGALKNAAAPRSATTSAITGPAASPSNGGAR